jgi:hypothetical protein
VLASFAARARDAAASAPLAAPVAAAVQDGLQGNIKHLWKDVYGPGSPDGSEGFFGVFQDIELVGREFKTMRQQLEKMSCDWRFTPRTALLRDGLFAPIHFCKPTFRAVFGGSDGFWDSDLQEMHDALGSFGLNTISDSIEAEEGSWSRIFPNIEYTTKHLLKSPGWANREEAIALAGADLMAAHQGQLRASRLLLEVTDTEYDRLVEKKEKDLALLLLLGLKGATLPVVEN